MSAASPSGTYNGTFNGTLEQLSGLLANDGTIDTGRCELMGIFSFATQGFMGIVVIAGLVLKRSRERPRRPWLIWFLDVSKQCCGALFVHFVNLVSSDLIASAAARNPCTLYFLHVAIDTTGGVLLVLLFVKLSAHYLEPLDPEFCSGIYGTTQKWRPWLKQLGVYLSALAAMKAIVILMLSLWSGLFRLGDYLLSWLDFNLDVQVAFVVAIFPLTMTTVQFLLTDAILAYNGQTVLPEGPTAVLEQQPLVDGADLQIRSPRLSQDYTALHQERDLETIH